eukprot:scaffold1931_cov162-Amphora_coffeaeformis.AAC.5
MWREIVAIRDTTGDPVLSTSSSTTVNDRPTTYRLRKFDRPHRLQGGIQNGNLCPPWRSFRLKCTRDGLTLCFLRLQDATLLTGPNTQGRRKALFSVQQRGCRFLCRDTFCGWESTAKSRLKLKVPTIESARGPMKTLPGCGVSAEVET